MSFHDRAAAAVLTQLATAGNGTFLGIGIAYVAYRTIRKYTAMSSALGKIREAPELHPSDLRSILSGTEDDGHVSNSNSESEKLVIVRGVVELKSAIEKGNWKGFRGANLLISEGSGEKGVILEQSQTCIYNEWKGFFGWTADLRSMLLRSANEQESSFMRKVPFVLVEAGNLSLSDFVVVDMEGSRHPLPLKTVYQHLQPISASPYTFFQALLGLEYPVGLLYKEKILPLGKDIMAIGICRLKDGTLEIKSCKDLPYFLSNFTKDQMVTDISFKTKVLMWGGVVLGSIALGMLCYSIPRNWIRWKEWRYQGRQQNDSPSSDAPAEVASDEESGDVPEGELCVICLTRRRRAAFVPCGHLVCCQRCAFSVERDVSPKCPVCRQTIRASVRIYES